MRLITFKTIEGKNFLSFGDENVTVSLKQGVNAIVGSNLDKEDSKNGAGKSSITELLYYSLYGNTLREIHKDYIQNSLTKKKCEVSLEFDISFDDVVKSYKIVRQLNPTKCNLFEDGKDVTRSTLAKTNDYIQSLIRTPAAVFRNSVIMTANTALPFLALSKTDKRKFVESVLGLEIFTSMVLKVREEYSSLKRDYEISYNKFETLNKELLFNLDQLNNYEETKQQRIKQLEDKKVSLLDDIKIHTKKLKEELLVTDHLNKEVDFLNNKIVSIEKKQAQINSYIVKLDTEISSEIKQKNKLEETKDNCPTCKRGYSAEHVDHAQKLIAAHDSVIVEKNKLIQQAKEGQIKLSIELESAKDSLKTVTKLIQESREAQQHNNQLEVLINFCKNNIQDIDNDIKFYTSQHNNELKGKVSSLESAVSLNKEQTDKLNNELNVYDTVKYVISEEGIKTFLVKKILAILNSRIAFYLQKLEANCLCTFNEFFDEEIIDENSKPKSYFNFSGGERKRIDLACLFAFADIRKLQGDVNFSTVFYDELLDSSLDDRGVYLTLRVLRERFNENNESCYIITHRGPEVTTKAEHVIHVVKRNGISVIAQ